MQKNYPVTGREIDYPDHYNILPTTNLKGAITYCNEDFIKTSGFSLDELVGHNHTIVRHPDMPPAAFGNLWTDLKAKRLWMGMVKNRRKNGDHYWVNAARLQSTEQLSQEAQRQEQLVIQFQRHG